MISISEKSFDTFDLIFHLIFDSSSETGLLINANGDTHLFTIRMKAHYEMAFINETVLGGCSGL